MVLGLLASEGPMHGYQIRRTAERTGVESWGGVNIGTLYRELHRMEEEELVESVRTEQLGRRPARTVYQITDEGHRELVTLRGEAFRTDSDYLDQVGVALLFGGRVDRQELSDLLSVRRQLLAAHLEALKAERIRYSPELTPAAIAVYRRGEMRIAAEIAWHDEVEEDLLNSSVGGDTANPPARSPDGRAPAIPLRKRTQRRRTS